MKCEVGLRICPRCGYKIEDKELIRCPRCHQILLKKCSECNGCFLS